MAPSGAPSSTRPYPQPPPKIGVARAGRYRWAFRPAAGNPRTSRIGNSTCRSLAGIWAARRPAIPPRASPRPGKRTSFAPDPILHTPLGVSERPFSYDRRCRSGRRPRRSAGRMIAAAYLSMGPPNGIFRVIRDIAWGAALGGRPNVREESGIAPITSMTITRS